MSTPDPLELGAFAATLGSDYGLDLGQAGRLTLTLVEAVANGDPPEPQAGPEDAAPPLRQPFSLVFRGPREPLLPQATYGLGHETLGGLAIFLVPIARDDDGVRYEAVFG